MKLLNLVVALLSALLIGTVAHHLAGVDALAATGTVLGAGLGLELLGFSLPFGSLAAFTITTTALNSAFGTVYKHGDKSERDLFQKIYYGATFDQDLFTKVSTKLTEYQEGLSSSTAVTQPYQTDFTPSGSVVFAPIKLSLQAWKIDVQLSSHDIWDKWVAFLHDMEKRDESMQAFVRYVMENHVLPQHLEDWELNIAYAGVYAAPTPGTAGAVGTTINGVKKVINDAITATTITPITTGAADSDPATFVQQIQDYVAQISTRARKKPMILAMSEDLELRFRNGMRELYPTTSRDIVDLLKVANYPNIEVRGYPAMGTSGKYFCTPKTNALKAVRGTAREWQWVSDIRLIKGTTDQWAAYGFRDHSLVFTNDQDT